MSQFASSGDGQGLSEPHHRLVNDQVTALGWNSSHPSTTDQNPDHLVTLAEGLLRARQERASFFPDGLFGEAGWDILLKLFIAASREKQVAVAALCATSNGFPSTTARWINVLDHEGLIAQHHGPDGEYRSLTAKGHRAMQDYLSAVQRRA